MGGRCWTRRGFLASLAAGAASGGQTKGHLSPPEFSRYADPATELPVVRLTSPAYTSSLPAPCLRAVSRKRTWLIFSCDRTGSRQLMRMFLNTGEVQQLTEVSDLDPSSVSLAHDDRSVYFFDGPSLRHLVLSSLHEHEIYRVPAGWTRAPGFSLSADGARACLAEERNGRWRLRLVPLRARVEGPVTAVEASGPLADPMLRPQSQEILYRDASGGLNLAGYDGRAARRLLLAPGRLGCAFWTTGGDRLLYLNLPGRGHLNAVREWVVGTDSDRLVAETSQFAVFAPNADASVFVGASASHASPYVLLLLRVTRRELALCEHRASDPARVSPVFSPDSQRVYFQSDRDGKPALYSIAVNRLVERTSD